MRYLNDILFLLGFGAFVCGVGCYDVKAAFVAGGLVLMALGCRTALSFGTADNRPDNRPANNRPENRPADIRPDKRPDGEDIGDDPGGQTRKRPKRSRPKRIRGGGPF